VNYADRIGVPAPVQEVIELLGGGEEAHRDPAKKRIVEIVMALCSEKEEFHDR
jgi:hypothetical protein